MTNTAGCACTGTGLGNTGYPSGLKPFGVVTGIVMVPLLNDEGTRNGLPLNSSAFGQDYLDAVNNENPSKRFYPYLGLKSVTPEEGDAVFATDDSGVRSWLRNGIQTITYSVWNVTEQYFAKVNTACTEFGIYEIDNCGNLKGQVEGDVLYPRPMNSDSFNAKFLPATNDAVAQVVFNVDYDKNTSNANQWMLPASEFGVINLLQIKGLIDVIISIVDVVSATSFIADVEMDYGFANELKPWTGAVAADFNLLNVTTPGIITATVVESATIPGRYTFTVPTMTASDMVVIDAFKASTGNMLNGFESEDVEFEYVF